MKNYQKIRGFKYSDNSFYTIEIIVESFFYLIKTFKLELNDFYVSFNDYELELFVSDNFINQLIISEIKFEEFAKDIFNIRQNIFNAANSGAGDFLTIKKWIIEYEAIILILYYKFDNYILEKSIKYKTLDIPSFFANYKPFFLPIKNFKFVKYFLESLEFVNVSNDYLSIDLPESDFFKYLYNEEDYILWLCYGFLKKNNLFFLPLKNIESTNNINKLGAKINVPKIDQKSSLIEYVEGVPLIYLKEEQLISQLCILFKLLCTQKINRVDYNLYFKKKINNLNLDINLISFLNTLSFDYNDTYIIHSDLHLKNIIFDRKIYLIDLEYCSEFVIERDLAAICVDLFWLYSAGVIKSFLFAYKKEQLTYNKNTLFFEIILRLTNIYKINEYPKIKTLLNNWRLIYDTI